jgi:hypothetical protein
VVSSLCSAPSPRILLRWRMFDLHHFMHTSYLIILQVWSISIAFAAHTIELGSPCPSLHQMPRSLISAKGKRLDRPRHSMRTQRRRVGVVHMHPTELPAAIFPTKVWALVVTARAQRTLEIWHPAARSYRSLY